MTKGDRIKLALDRMGKSVADLARAIGHPDPLVRRMITENRPEEEMTVKTAKFLGVKPEWLRAGLDYDAPKWAKAGLDADALARALKMLNLQGARLSAVALALELAVPPRSEAESTARLRLSDDLARLADQLDSDGTAG